MMRSELTIRLVNRLLLLSLFALPMQVSADLAILVDQAVLVETNPEATVTADDQAIEDAVEEQPQVGTQTNASYLSFGGWAVTGTDFIDAATYVFDFGGATTVTAATLRIPIRDNFPQNDSTPLEVTFFSDDGIIEFTDYSNGFNTPIAEVDVALSDVLEIDVTGAVNSALNVGQYIGFRVRSGVAPSQVDTDEFPPYAGVRFTEEPILEFVPGPAPTLPAGVSAFDVYSLVVPEIDVPGVGDASALFNLIDPENLTFQLSSVTVSDDLISEPEFSGSDLFNCSAFSPPDVTGVAEGIASYSVNSGILDIPSVDLFGEQIAVRLELIEGSDPPLFETLSLDDVQSGPSEVTDSALQGGLLLEPAQDFVPLCHGWILVGDFIRNRVVERNVISGQTGATYSFNTAPDQFTLDRVNNRVYMTVFPESERLYRLDLDTGVISYDRVEYTFTSPIAPVDYTYGYALRDIALGEDGNVFAIMLDGEGNDPENEIPYTDTGLWMGIMDLDGGFLEAPLPLEEPIRIEYDPVLDHVFLATESNLATFNFDPTTNLSTFVVGTDISVGSGCTDFDISPDGTRLAYTCPDGNYGDGDFSIADMNPEAYFDNDGAWFFGTSPVSATFNADGTLLVGTDNDRLYIFDVRTHLILEDFELGLLEGETINKVRLSEDGNVILIFLNNENRADNSKFYWMDMPPITGTPL